MFELRIGNDLYVTDATEKTLCEACKRYTAERLAEGKKLSEITFQWRQIQFVSNNSLGRKWRRK